MVLHYRSLAMKNPTLSPEFKREAVRLLEQKDTNAAQLARELGVKRNQLYKWQKEIQANGKKAFPGKGQHHIAAVLDQQIGNGATFGYFLNFHTARLDRFVG